MNNQAHCRPREHLIAAGRLYPEAWKQVDSFRADRGLDGLPDWPSWCFCPLAGSYAVVSADAGMDQLSMSLVGDVGRIGALAAWRPTQGIYRFDETLYQSLIDTPITGDVPAEVLHCMPEWCVYIETPEQQWCDAPLAGFFAHLEWDAKTGREELRLLLDITLPDGNLLQPLPIHLGSDIKSGIDAACTVAQKQAWNLKIPQVADFLRENMPEDLGIEPMISLLLYICSRNAEIGDGVRQPIRPTPKKTKKGLRLFPPDKPTAWDVGVRMGAALRRGYESANEEGGTHTGPRAHMRRAHWHTYRVGPGREKRVVKWLPTIQVNVEDVDALPAVVKKVD